jgi:MFS family permease
MIIALPLCAAMALGYLLLEEDDGQSVEQKRFCLPRGPLALLGALGFLGSMAEGSIADWSGIFLKDHFGVTDGFAPLALTVFSIMMLLTRVGGDNLKMRFGARSLVSAGATTAGLGLAVAIFGSSAYVALAGFAVAGIGLALVFPFVFSAAGAQGPMALASVATMAYSGSLTGPPVIGAVAHGLGLQAAIGLVAIVSVAIACIAARAEMLK